MSCIFGGRPRFGFGDSFGLYVAKDATTNRKIMDTICLGLADIHFSGLISPAAACILGTRTGDGVTFTLAH